MVVPSLAKLAILFRQTPDQKAGFLASSLHEIIKPQSLKGDENIKDNIICFKYF